MPLVWCSFAIKISYGFRGGIGYRFGQFFTVFEIFYRQYDLDQV